MKGLHQVVQSPRQLRHRLRAHRFTAHHRHDSSTCRVEIPRKKASRISSITSSPRRWNPCNIPGKKLLLPRPRDLQAQHPQPGYEIALVKSIAVVSPFFPFPLVRIALHVRVPPPRRFFLQRPLPVHPRLPVPVSPKAPLQILHKMPVKQPKNVTLAESSCNLKMLPVGVGAVGMWESGVWFLAGFPSAEGRVGNSSWFLEFSTLSSARHFHRAWPAGFSRIGTRRPAIGQPFQGGSRHGWGVGNGLGRRAGLGAWRAGGRGGGLAAESEDPPQLGLDAGRKLKRIESRPQALLLPKTAWVSVQPVWMSVRLSE